MLDVDEAQQSVLDDLKDVLAQVGTERFSSGPIVEPTRRFFPDLWSGTAADVHIITQRLMRYAGLEHQFTIETYHRAEAPSSEEDTYDWSAAGWFAGIVDGKANFGASVENIKDPEDAAGVMSHEVAHAFREHHQLIVEPRLDEELLTDITTVALGFGILTTNNTDRHRTAEYGSIQISDNSGAGYLAPPLMSFLLAAQCVSRGLSRSAVARVKSALEPNQAEYFAEAVKTLTPQVDALRGFLGVSEGMNAAVFEPLDVPVIPPGTDDAFEAEPITLSEDFSNEGLPVFRKRKLHPFFALLAGTIPGAVTGFLLMMFVVPIRDMEHALYVPLVLALATAAYTMFEGLKTVCSDEECRTALRVSERVCPGCRGNVMGDYAARAAIREELEDGEGGDFGEACSECGVGVECVCDGDEVQLAR